MDLLEAARREIGEIDRDLVRLIVRRMEVAKAIGALKRQAGCPLRHDQVEQQVLQRYVEGFAGKRYPEGFAQRLARLLVECSILVQSPNHSHDDGKEKDGGRA